MAIGQTVQLNIAELTKGIMPSQTVDAAIATRLDSVEFFRDGGIAFTFSTRLGGAEKPITVTRVQLGTEPIPAEPPEDILDENGNVLMAAGCNRPRVPSISEMRETKNSEALKAAETWGETLDAARSLLYQTAIALNPAWANGQEV